MYYGDEHEQYACQRRTPTGAPQASRLGSRAPSHGARRPPPGWRRQAARRRRAVLSWPSPASSTGAFSITVHQASGQGGAPIPCLLVPCSVLDVAVIPQCSSSSSSARLGLVILRTGVESCETRTPVGAAPSCARSWLGHPPLTWSHPSGTTRRPRFDETSFLAAELPMLGKQMQALQEYLIEHPRIKHVFYDYASMPQGA